MLGKLLPFGVNCRLQLAGLGKKREETVKLTCFSWLYVESDFGGAKSEERAFQRFARAKIGAREKNRKEGVGEGNKCSFLPVPLPPLLIALSVILCSLTAQKR